MSELIKCVL